MILQPLLSWWILAIIFLPIVIFCVWLIVINKTARKSWMRRLAIIILILLAFLRPSIPGVSKHTGNASLDVFFIIDATYSVKAMDYDGNKERLEGIRKDVKDIAAKLVGARFSVVIFDTSAYVALPLTSDTSTLASIVDTIQPQYEFYGKGSSIDMPLEITEKELSRVSKVSPGRGLVLFYLGDGEQTEEEKPKSFSPIKKYIKGGAVLGYGTSSGGKMHGPFWGTKYQWDSQEFIKDLSTGNYPAPDALSKIDEANLKNIADQAGIKYIHRTKPGEIEGITKAINVGSIVRQNKDTSSYDDISWMFMPLVLLLTCFDAGAIYHTFQNLRRQQKRSKL